MQTPPSFPHCQAPDFRPQGALRQEDQSVLWRLWASQAQAVTLVVWPGGERREVAMADEGYGYFTAVLPDVEEGMRYAYRLDDGPERPDPASRCQPESVHAPSAVFSPGAFEWTDHNWPGVKLDDLVLYELHVGTFTPEGTFDAVKPRLQALADLGVTALEIMPVAQFPGPRNWGYDGVYLNAVQNSYGGPQGLQRLVDAAHAVGLGVYMDVVYNHLGPEGNYLAEFARYFTTKYRTPWGLALNYDDSECDPVRQFITDNARMWVRDFHCDGLRLDAVQTIYDTSAYHVLAAVKKAVDEEAALLGRTVHVTAESNQNDVRLLQDREHGGYQLDAVWNDDFHHSVHCLATGKAHAYYLDFDRVEHLQRTYNQGWSYDGCYSRYRRQCYGSSAAELDRARLIACTHNHDQVANQPNGSRWGGSHPPSKHRLACGLLLLSPFTPLLFMGQEYGEESPFPFFTSFSDGELIEAVRKGRARELVEMQFAHGSEIPDPHAEETFLRAKLSWSWPEGSWQAGVRRLYGDLLAARRDWPALRNRTQTRAELLPASRGEDQSPDFLVLWRGLHDQLMALANLTAAPRPFPGEVAVGERQFLLSSEEPRYGGERDMAGPLGDVRPHEWLIFGLKEWRT